MLFLVAAPKQRDRFKGMLVQETVEHAGQHALPLCETEDSDVSMRYECADDSTITTRLACDLSYRSVFIAAAFPVPYSDSTWCNST